MKEKVQDETLEKVPSDQETEETVIDLPIEPEEKTELELAQIKAEEMEDKFLRAQAEIANMRNRFQKERETLAKYRSQDLAKELLPAIDNLERALAIEVTEEQGESIKKGIEMVLESMLHGFKQVGVEEIASLGETFDPNFHQAVQTMPIEGDQKPDEIVQVLQKGYKLYDRVLRPAMVIVAQ